MASALSRGSKHVVMSKKEWQQHPQRCSFWGWNSYCPGLYTGKQTITVIFSDPK